jgi:hypothetical protein
MKKSPYKIIYILIFEKNHLPVARDFGSLYYRLKSVNTKAIFCTSVNANFAELNRNRPTSSEAEFIACTACPQVQDKFLRRKVIFSLTGI